MSTASLELSYDVEGLTLSGKRDIDGKGNELSNTLVGKRDDNHLFDDGNSDTL